MKLHALYAGMLAFKDGVRTPVTNYLIEHNSNYILFDTGINLQCKNHLKDYWGELVANTVQVEMSHNDFIVHALAQLGISETDINFVVLSHLHLDHTGAIGYFPNAKYVIQKKELVYALSDSCKCNPLYIQRDIQKEVDWLIIDEDYDLFHDGVIQLIQTPGHSAGHQSMIVDHKYLLSADACNDFDVFAGNEPVTSPVDEALAIQSLNKIRNYINTCGLKLLPPHDIHNYLSLNRTYE